MNVLRIDANATYPLRHRVLRQGFPIEECVFPGDEEEQTFHLGAFIDNSLVSVASFYFERNPEFEDEYQYRLRGMATDQEHRGKGLSSELLKVAFPIIKQNMCTMVWCNARTSAVGFYEKVGFIKKGDEFDIPGIGPHYLMFKKF